MLRLRLSRDSPEAETEIAAFGTADGAVDQIRRQPTRNDQVFEVAPGATILQLTITGWPDTIKVQLEKTT